MEKEKLLICKDEILANHVHNRIKIQNIMEKTHNITPELCKLVDLYSDIIKIILDELIKED